MEVPSTSAISNCLEYSSIDTCSLCRYDHYVLDGKCQPVALEIPNCLYYFYNVDTLSVGCLVCDNDYIFSNNWNECLPMPKDLKKCSDYTYIKCTTCKSGYY